jgi:hypothetical protein
MAVVVAAMTGATGCKEQVTVRDEPEPHVPIERLRQGSVDKIDLLLVIDNSRFMADKQAVLKQAVPDLLLQLVNPLCICDAEPSCGAVPFGLPLPADMQPMDPTSECPPGSRREFDPILDIHVGVITTSLGGHGSDSCEGAFDASENDHGYLIDRDAIGPASGIVPTWQSKKFLAWDPRGDSHSPPGLADATELTSNLTAIVGGAGEGGCGYEAQLESWYRFLVDPDPYESIAIELDANGSPNAVLNGTDATLLQMRRDFLRPDSLLAIVMLTDENDCSIRDGGLNFFAAQRYQPGTNNVYHLPKPRAACVNNPNDPCCVSCGEPPACLQYADDGTTCTQLCDDSADDCAGALSDYDDALPLRCFDQKRRFGIDFLQPIDRYLTGLTAPTVADRNAQLVPNPLFMDLNPNDENATVRDAGLVFIAGIVGVPWQDIARRNSAGQPDLLAGLDDSQAPVGGFQDAYEMVALGTWDIILGDPAQYVPPLDPLMIESVDPRTGANPITQDPLAPPGDPNGNAINGSEYTILQRDDLQYACVFDLPIPKDCSMGAACECPISTGEATDNPLCDPAQPNIQLRAKALPGIRELQVLKQVGSQGIVGSICPAQLVDATLANFAYRPAVNAIAARLKRGLAPACLPHALTADAKGQVSCVILEARKIPDAGACTSLCNAPGRRPMDQDHPTIDAAKQDPFFAIAQWNCFCEMAQTDGADQVACQQDLSDAPVNSGGAGVNGWCYVDGESTPPVGNPELVLRCPAGERHFIRFVGEGHAAPGATLFLSCP